MVKIVCCLIFAIGTAYTQQFEAASVRLHTDATPSTGRSGIEETPGLIRIVNLSLRSVIASAFGVPGDRISGPSWLSDEAVDITAKPPAGYSHEQLQPLLRNLLSDRFKLAVHHESKEVSGFSMVVIKGGSKLHEATQPRDYFTVRPGLVEEKRASMAQLAAALSRLTGGPVVDNTGLAAAYEVKLEWMPDEEQKGDAAVPGLSLFTALSEQLGLRLQPQRLTVDTIVVDHMEKAPAEN